jgi:hypothetical protein
MAVQGGTEIMAYSRFWRSRLRGLESLESLVDHVYDRRYNLKALPDELQEQAIFIVDNKNRIIVNRLFILDDRGRLSPQLSSWLSRYPIPHLNSTEPVVVDLTAQARNKIMEIYRRDFEIYDYVTAQGGSAEIGGRQFAPR